jgi:hypothetical protein
MTAVDYFGGDPVVHTWTCNLEGRMIDSKLKIAGLVAIDQQSPNTNKEQNI